MTKRAAYYTIRWTNPQTGRSFAGGNTYGTLRDAIAQAARTAGHGYPCDVFRNKNGRRVLWAQFQAF